MSEETEITTDLLFEALCATCEVLDELGCRYFLAGGTLLGARREGDLIAHDIDFDLDCLVEDEQRILSGRQVFQSRGLDVEKQMSMAPRSFATGDKTGQALYVSCVHVNFKGLRVGDIYIFTPFNDGIARRFDIASGVYANSKMSIPSWFYTGDTWLKIRDRRFRSVRDPEVVLEKIYGSNWRQTVKPGEQQAGRNPTSGAVQDADIERLVLHAMDNGWQPDPTDGPQWPQPIKWYGWAGPGDIAREWIQRHEPLIRDEIVMLLDSPEFLGRLREAGEGELKMLVRVVAAKAIQSEGDRRKTAGLSETESRIARHVVSVMRHVRRVQRTVSRVLLRRGG